MDRSQPGGGELWPEPVLCVVTDAAIGPERFLTAARHAVAGGADIIQLRAREAAAGQVLAWSRVLLGACRRSGARLLVNDRVDVAAASGADGCHLPESGLPVSAARHLLGGDALIGVSVHSTEVARRAARDGADYLIFGHIFATASKAGLPPRGLEQLAEVCRAVTVPVLAIGGIDEENVSKVLAAGAAGAAVMSAVMEAREPEEAVRALKTAMTRGVTA